MHFCWVTQSNFYQKPQFTSSPDFQDPVGLISCLPKFTYDRSGSRAKQNTSGEPHQREILQLAWREHWNIDALRSLWYSLGRSERKWAILTPAVLTASLSVSLCIIVSEPYSLCEQTLWLFMWTCLHVYTEHVVVGGHTRVYGKKWKREVSVQENR